MANYLQSVQNVLNAIPIYSLASTTANALQGAKSNEPKTEARVQSIVRASLAYYIYPKAISQVVVFNLALGTLHLILGSVLRFRARDTDLNDAPTWESIATQVHKGCSHFFTGGYDYAVGYLLKQKYIGILGLAAFVLVPPFALLTHQKFLKKPEDTPPTPKEIVSTISKCVNLFLKTDVTAELLNQELEKLEADSFKPEEVKTVVAKYVDQRTAGSVVAALSILFLLKPPSEIEADQAQNLSQNPSRLGSHYLDPNCLVSQLASEFTTTIMPQIDKPNNNEKKPYQLKNFLEYLLSFIQTN